MNSLFNQKDLQKGDIHQKERIDFPLKVMYGVWKDIVGKAMKGYS
jgi:hypothetical protein